MSDIIKLLPDSVANQIAAGEVIQRPASVIKELVENSVDAGATDIRIYIKDAGRTLIQVVDNGKGMSETDARMAFERHATSKIRGAGDLFTLRTMGFRGEALPSVCAISQVELKTRTQDSQMGTRLVINGSKVETQEPCVCDAGANIMVKNLFFNVPARRKFLKSDNVELSNIMREFERLALVNNNIRMCIDSGSRVLDLRAGTLKQRIGDIWKNSLDLHLLPVEVDTSLIKISGFVSRPEYARRRNPLQFLIVNGRNMRHPYFHKAVMSCYESLIAADTQPCYFLKFQVDPSSIDVNIHPTKNEIKFEYEQEIWPILQASVRAALGKFGAVPSIDFNSDVLPVDPLPPGVAPEKPSLDIPADYNPFSDARRQFDNAQNMTEKGWHGGFSGRKANPAYSSSNWETLYSDFVRQKEGEPVRDEKVVEKDKNEDGVIADLSGSRQVGSLCLQYASQYIITSSRDGLIIIDQHRAHVRILYERYRERLGQKEHVTRKVMFPEGITLDPTHQEAFAGIADELAALGYVIEYDEDNRWTINSVPGMLKDDEARDLVLRVLDSICEEGENYGKESDPSENLLSHMALTMARAMAIRRGQHLGPDEMEHLVGELFSLPDPSYTPNGGLVYCLIDGRRLESMFK